MKSIWIVGLALMGCAPRPAAQATMYSPAPSVLEQPSVGVPVDPAPVVEETEIPTPDQPADTVDEPVVTYHLRRGETLDHFARWAELPVEVIAEASDFGLDVALPVGALVRVPADTERRSRVELRRDGHHERRAEGYLASRGGSIGTEFHVVRTGETAWEIARDNGRLPVWLVETFNPSLDLESLRPGQAVMLPVTADMVDAVSMLEDDAPTTP